MLVEATDNPNASVMRRTQTPDPKQASAGDMNFTSVCALTMVPIMATTSASMCYYRKRSGFYANPRSICASHLWADVVSKRHGEVEAQQLTSHHHIRTSQVREPGCANLAAVRAVGAV